MLPFSLVFSLPVGEMAARSGEALIEKYTGISWSDRYEQIQQKWKQERVLKSKDEELHYDGRSKEKTWEC